MRVFLLLLGGGVESPSNLSQFKTKLEIHTTDKNKVTRVPKIRGQRSVTQQQPSALINTLKQTHRYFEDAIFSKMWCLTSINRQQTNANFLSFFLCNMLLLPLLASSKLKIQTPKAFNSHCWTDAFCVCV